MTDDHLREQPPVPEKHRALDSYRAGSDRLVARIGDALGDADEPVLLTRGRPSTTLSELEDRISAVLAEHDREARS
mgnify:CR=1 FL=1